MAKKPLTSPSALYRIEKRLTPKAKAAFQAAVKQWQKDVAAGKPPDPNALKPLVKVTEDGTRLAGTAAAAQIAGVRPGIKLAFDITNPQAVKWAKANAARLIKDIGTETRNAVKQAIARSVSGEMTTAQVGRYVREIVGLTERQEQGVFNFYERAIASGFSDADALDEANGYAESLRRYRSEVIARSEVLRAENAGQELLWQQGVESGQLKGLVRQWLATDDELTCPICGEMNGQTTPIGEPWEGPEGETFETPQDSHPQCRCSEGLVEAGTAKRARVPVVKALKEWDEEQHPRVPAGSGDESGEFTDAGGGGSSSDAGAPEGSQDNPISGFDGKPAREGWENDLSPEQREAVTAYTGGLAKPLNERLRSDEPLSDTDDAVVTHLDAAIERAGTYDQPVTVYRGLTIGDIEGMPSGRDLAGLSAAEGEALLREAIDNHIERTFPVGIEFDGGGGFQSSSFLVEPALDASSIQRSSFGFTPKRAGVVLEIRATRGAFLRNLTQMNDEEELLLGRHTRYRVTKVIRSATIETTRGSTNIRTVVQVDQVQ